jgi:hypothetical protein
MGLNEMSVKMSDFPESLWRETSAYKTDQILKRTPADARAALDLIRQEAREEGRKEGLREAAVICNQSYDGFIGDVHKAILALITKDAE